ncbi:Endonuclease/exonuclease/phosphatase [Podospora aff. communis PSN243]|uniref:DNA-(apurinic or apyrimidinic site) endonuclease 2 n=1 Tax=Podospora aff. communis PSN243 TaxID=3040156 RepID=A0AAV9GYQ0_9PEZI|nr:Endonuclease/exonuclease/phosphatase [Podospora aff. communis PSN243]
MGLRITTWNVNGIRNPFSYQPWRENRTYQAMFDKLEADIVVMQETKIQRKDLQDDMVLVPGWDVYFSLPKHKKGYSGVAIYIRSSKCCPIRAEEGITGVLCPPGSSVKFRDLPTDQQIGGYPRPGQLSSALDEPTLDSEGRCVILEFPAFVLIGVYTPATRDETRTEFREGWIDALDVRVRNLVAMGKQVFLCGDLNIIRSELDTAGLAEQLRKEVLTLDDFYSTPTRRFFNQLVFGGRVIGERDDGREEPVLWDICREFHPSRPGMYTCWETRKNARPGNFGSRIDYVLCSSGIKNWFIDSNIQEGLLGSDHCPVYATLDDTVTRDGLKINLLDIMNPEGMFKDGQRLREWTAKDLLPTSAKLIPEFDKRRSIRDMFFKKPAPSPKSSLSTSKATSKANSDNPATPVDITSTIRNLSPTSRSVRETGLEAQSPSQPPATFTPLPVIPKRQAEALVTSHRPQKKTKATLSKESSAKSGSGPAQRSLMGFFKPKASDTNLNKVGDTVDSETTPTQLDGPSEGEFTPQGKKEAGESVYSPDLESWPGDNSTVGGQPRGKVFDPIESKESWSKLLGKRKIPKCEHGEDCQIQTTKKAGINCGRSFFSCSRPLGPSGRKEEGTEFRCGTFIWSSDWNGRQ